MTLPPTRRIARAAAGVVLLLAGTCLPACTGASRPGASRSPSSGASPTVTPTSPTPPSSVLPLHLERGTNWLIATSALSSLLRLDQAGTVTRRWFDDQHTMVIGTADRSLPADWKNPHVASFTSLDGIRQATARGLPSDVRAVLYDIEAWPLTPAAEQADPVRSIATAAGLVHGAGLQFIASPGTDLMGKLHPGWGPYNRTYVATRFGADASAPADIFVVQAQTYQNDSATYGDFVRQVTAQARAAHPGILVLAGLSTGPHGQPTTVNAMLAALAATSGTVDGYWLNIPGRGAQCPTCGPPTPGIALDFLRQLGG